MKDITKKHKYWLVSFNFFAEIELSTKLIIGEYVLYGNTYYQVLEEHEGVLVAFTSDFINGVV